MKSLKIKFTLLCATLFVSSSVFSGTACVQNNNAIGLVGLDSSGSTVFAATPSSNNECSCDHFRFLKANTDTSMALSILLSAKMGDKKVRIDLLEVGNCSSAYRVYLH